MADEDRKEEGEKKEVKHITINVVGANKTEVQFKIKRTAQLGKLMDAYAEKTGVPKANRSVAMKFTYEGLRVDDEMTPDSLDMEDGDIIEVNVKQIGGF